MSMFRNVLINTIRKLQWHSIFNPPHNYKFLFRKAGGDDNASLHAENSRAVIDTIYGNTVKWNQLVQNGNFASTSNWLVESGVTFTVANNVASITKTSGNNGIYQELTLKSNHKYLIRLSAYCNESNIYLRTNAGAPYLDRSTLLDSGTWKTIKYIATFTNVATRDRFNIYQSLGTATTIQLKNVTIFDLTLLGIDNLTTTAQVEAWLSQNVGYQDYYPYDEGSLKSFNGTAIKSVGFNQFDESTLQAGKWISTDNGAINNNSGRRASSEYFKCYPLTQYYFNYFVNGVPSSVDYKSCVHFYDINKIWIGRDNVGFFLKGGLITSPANAAYFRMCSTQSGGNLCINLSSDKNGTYEPYWEDVLPIDPTKVYGKVNGEGSSVQCFPNGMMGIGNIKDTLTASEAVVKICSVDLSTMTVQTRYTGSTNKTISLTLPYSYTKSSVAMLSQTYQQIGKVIGAAELSSPDNKEVGLYTYNGGTSVSDTILYAVIPVGSSLTNNDVIVYSRNINTTYTDLIYSEDCGVTGTPLTAFKYKVDKYSTEEVLVPSGTVPTSTCINADIDYQYQGYE